MKCDIYRFLYFPSDEYFAPGSMSLYGLSDNIEFEDPLTYPYRLSACKYSSRTYVHTMMFYDKLNRYSSLSYSSGHEFRHMCYDVSSPECETYEIEVLDFDGRDRL